MAFHNTSEAVIIRLDRELLSICILYCTTGTRTKHFYLSIELLILVTKKQYIDPCGMIE